MEGQVRITVLSAVLTLAGVLGGAHFCQELIFTVH